MNTRAIADFFKYHGDLAHNIGRVIHVAGTNGKGSTCAFLRSLLESCGYTVNSFTSPHLVNERERIRIKGQLISTREYAKYRAAVECSPKGAALSIFEKFVAVALLAFNEHKADFTILEVGLGGRLDATNIISYPVASVITPIDFDHQHILGSSLQEIATEKAGIIKCGCPVFSAYQQPEAAKVLKEAALKHKASIYQGGSEWSVQLGEDPRGNRSLKPVELRFPLSKKSGKSSTISFSSKDLALKGEHQIYNAALALVVVKEVLQLDIELSNKKAQLIKGLRSASWAGRLQALPRTLYNQNFNRTAEVLCDGAHNEHGAQALVRFIASRLLLSNKLQSTINNDAIAVVGKNCNLTGLLKPRRVVLIIGLMQTKDLLGYLKSFEGIPGVVFYCINLPGKIGHSSSAITKAAKKFKFCAYNLQNLPKATAEAASYTGRQIVIYCGSLYLIGKLLKDNKIEVH